METNIEKTLQKGSATGKWYTIAMSTAVLTAVVTCIILALIIANHIRVTILLNQREQDLAQLKSQVNIGGDKENTLTRIRQLDMQFRQNWFYRLDFTQKGGYLLLGSVVIMLLSFKFANTLNKDMPSPGPASDRLKEQIHQAKLSRWILTSGAAIVVLGILLLLTTPRIDFGKVETVIPYFPSEEQINRNWPYFRGPGGQGIVTDMNVPQKWDGETGEGILWKTEVPLRGRSSPIVWEDRVFLSGADPNKQNVFCFDAVSGSLLWTGDVNVPPLKAGQKPLHLGGSDSAGYAAPTVTTDGRRVYAIFPTGVVGCFDFEGNQVWEKDMGRPDSFYGYACSLVMFQNLLLIQFDQGAEEDQKSEMIALDGATNNIVWRKQRPVGDSWATPIIINVEGKKQLITCGDPWVIAYNPADGTELWRAKCLSGDVAATPIYANGLIVVIEMYKRFIAIRPDGSGDVTETHIAWEVPEITPESTSPISNGELVFILMGDYSMGCFRSSDGEKLWEQEIGSYFQASPSLAGDKLYLLSEKGEMFIIEAGTEYKELAKYELYEECFASPAFVNGRIYIRGDKHLYCIGE